MIRKIRSLLVRTQEQKERGSSEIINTLILIPILIALTFGIVDLSTYFQTKQQVQNITRDAARTVAMFGGAHANVPINTLDASVTQARLTDRLYRNGNCVLSSCSQPPEVVCTPCLTTNAAQLVGCRVIYYYGGIGTQVSALLGLDLISSIPMDVQETFVSETYYSDTSLQASIPSVSALNCKPSLADSNLDEI